MYYKTCSLLSRENYSCTLDAPICSLIFEGGHYFTAEHKFDLQ